MPVTFAHPAVSAPLFRPLGCYGNLSALVIGSFAPDLAYFLPFGISRTATHSLPGLFWFCLPAGLLSHVMFHRFLKGPLLELLPIIAARQPVTDQRRLSSTQWLAIIVSLLCGTITHIVWDAFTHEGGQVARVFPLLQVYLFSIGNYPVHMFKLLQHLSTCTGLFFVVWWSWRWIQNTPAQNGPRPTVWTSSQRSIAIMLVLTIPALFGIVAGVNATNPFHGMLSLRAFAVSATFTALPVFVLIIVLYCSAWQIKKLRLQVKAG